MNLPFLKTPLGAEPLLVEGWFAAPPARVFRAWTEPDELKRWFGRTPGQLREAHVDLRIGGAWRFVMNQADETDYVEQALEGEYLAIEPGVLLAFTWRHVRIDAAGVQDATPLSKVTIDFEPVGAGARLRLRHEGIRAEDARRGVGHGWSASFEKLEKLFTG